MANFQYTARDGGGRPRTGIVAADSTTQAAGDLRRRGWLILDLQPVGPGPVFALDHLRPSMWLPAGSLDVEMGLRQLAVMLRSGLSLLVSLQTVAEQARRQRMQLVWQDIAERIQTGTGLADAMAAHRVFPKLIVQLVALGEQSGLLDQVMERGARDLEKSRHLRAQTLTAMAYPAIVLLAAVGVSAFLVLSVIPKIGTLLKSLGRRLPAMTQFLLDISEFVQQYALALGLGIVAVIGAATALYLHPASRQVIDRLSLRVPLVGYILRLAGTAAFARGLATLLHSGITLVEGLRAIEQLMGNRHLARSVALARRRLLEGSSLASALEDSRAFLPMLARMVTIGESAGTLDDTLDEVAKFHEEQLDIAIRRLSLLIEPATVLIVGGIVGFVYIAFFMALFAAGSGGGR